MNSYSLMPLILEIGGFAIALAILVLPVLVVLLM